ncbi:MAG: dihydrodipicolinate synthase family protein, partial [Bacillota bacterium]
MNLENLSGLIPPMVTPFTDDEEVDLGQLRAEVNYLTQFDIAGLGVTGSTGEGVLLTDEEVRLITETVVDEVDGEIPVITGIIRNSTREALKTARMAREAGADGLLVTPTFYHTASDRGNYEYYRRITGEIKLPTIVYNVVPTNQISPELMARIGSLEHMIGVKQIEASKVTAMVDRCGDDIQVYSACDDMLYGTYAAGADGAIAAI